jgi:hypothetical protein
MMKLAAKTCALFLILSKSKKEKSNAIPVTGHTGPNGFIENRLKDGGEVVSFTYQLCLNTQYPK